MEGSGGPEVHLRGARDRIQPLFAPLLDSDGCTIGYLNPDGPLSGDLPGPDQTLLLETLAELTVLGLEIVRSRTTERAARAVAEAQRGQLEALMTESARVRGDVGLAEVLGTIAHAMTNAGGFDRAAVYLLVDGVTLEVRATVGLSDAEDAELKLNSSTLVEFSPVTKPEMLVSRSYLFDHGTSRCPKSWPTSSTRRSPTRTGERGSGTSRTCSSCRSWR